MCYPNLFLSTERIFPSASPVLARPAKTAAETRSSAEPEPEHTPEPESLDGTERSQEDAGLLSDTVSVASATSVPGLHTTVLHLTGVTEGRCRRSLIMTKDPTDSFVAMD